MNLRTPILAAFACAVLTASALAQSFSFSADSMTGSMVSGRERVVLKGRAKVVSDGMIISADAMELYGLDFRYIECTGSVSVQDDGRGIYLSTGHLFYDRAEKLARLTGPSVMEDRENGAVIKGNFIEHDDKRQTAIIQINVRIIKDDVVCRAEFARYDRASSILDLSGSPWVRKGSDEYRASSIRINLDSDDITLSGSVSGSVSSTTPTAPSATPTTGSASAPVPVQPVPGAPETSGGKP